MQPATSEHVGHATASRILLAVDGSPASLRATRYLRTFAPPQAQVRIVSVAEDAYQLIPLDPLVGVDLGSVRSELLRAAEDAVVDARTALSDTGLVCDARVIDLSRRAGDVRFALLEAVRTWRADLLVVGTRQHHGFQAWLEGAISEPLARRCPCAILVVPTSYDGEADAGLRRILFAVDGSETSQRALEYGVKFARPDTTLRVVHVLDQPVGMGDFVLTPPFEDALVKKGEAALAAAGTMLARSHVTAESAMISTEKTNDDVPHVIVKEADRWRAELVVMGTHGRRGLSRWLLGSVASRVLRITHVPVLLVHPAEG